MTFIVESVQNCCTKAPRLDDHKHPTRGFRVGEAWKTTMNHFARKYQLIVRANQMAFAELQKIRATAQ